jgi:Tub family
MYCNHSKAYGSIVFRMKHSGSGSGSSSSSVATAMNNTNHNTFSRQTTNYREGSFLDEKRLLHPGKKLKIHQHLLEIHQQQLHNGGGGMIMQQNDVGSRPFQFSLSADFFRREGKKHQQQDAADGNTTTTMKTRAKNVGSFELEVYSAESLGKDNPTLRSKISMHQQKLDMLLIQSDAAGFEECMLDFWDEFFPETKGLHYYDSETAVPRASHLHSFLTNPCPKAWGTVQCEIERIKTGSRLFPVYEYRLYVRGTPTDMELMFAKNKGRQEGKSNNYQIVMGTAGQEHQHRGDNNNNTGNVILGRLQSNFIGTEFQIFAVSSNHGGSNVVDDQPPTATKRATNTNRRAVANQHQTITSQSDYYAREDGAITYTANLLGSRPRIMDVCLPKIAVSKTDVTWLTYLASCATAAGSADDANNVANALPTDMLTCFRQLVARLDNNNNDGAAAANDNNNADTELPDFGLLALQNRPPWWNHELQSFVLNFGGRVSVASVKNFQLIERSNHDLVMLQFGRIKGRHSFTMDFQYPLTAVQAFAIAISSLQSKISFG